MLGEGPAARRGWLRACDAAAPGLAAASPVAGLAVDAAAELRDAGGAGEVGGAGGADGAGDAGDADVTGIAGDADAGGAGFSGREASLQAPPVCTPLFSISSVDPRLPRPTVDSRLPRQAVSSTLFCQLKFSALGGCRSFASGLLVKLPACCGLKRAFLNKDFVVPLVV